MNRIWKNALSIAAKDHPKAYRNYTTAPGRQKYPSRADRDARALAPSNGFGRAGRGEGCLCGEATLPDAGAGRGTGGCREEVKEHRAGGHAKAQLRPVSGCAEDRGGGTLGKVRMVRGWWLNNSVNGVRRRSWRERSIGSSGRDRRRRGAIWIRIASGIGGSIPTMREGIVADQGAHVFDGIHLLMNASYPKAVNASGGIRIVAGVIRRKP